MDDPVVPPAAAQEPTFNMNAICAEQVPIFVNECGVTQFGGVMRLNFGESVVGVAAPFARVSVVLTPTRAVEFARVILSSYRATHQSDEKVAAAVKALTPDAG